jgi:hypothetical protein
MKKFSFIGSLLLLTTVIVFLFIGCQKESAVADETVTPAAGGESVVVGTDGGDAKIQGLISEENAAAMSAAYAKSVPKGSTLSVTYSTKDLIAFLKTLNTKYKSDSVRVTFGIYDKKTAHTRGQIGRTTIFFMGNNIATSKGGVRTNAIGDIESSNFLNKGEMAPPPSDASVPE